MTPSRLVLLTRAARNLNAICTQQQPPANNRSKSRRRGTTTTGGARSIIIDARKSTHAPQQNARAQQTEERRSCMTFCNLFVFIVPSIDLDRRNRPMVHTLHPHSPLPSCAHTDLDLKNPGPIPPSPKLLGAPVQGVKGDIRLPHLLLLLLPPPLLLGPEHGGDLGRRRPFPLLRHRRQRRRIFQRRHHRGRRSGPFILILLLLLSSSCSCGRGGPLLAPALALLLLGLVALPGGVFLSWQASR